MTQKKEIHVTKKKTEEKGDENPKPPKNETDEEQSKDKMKHNNKVNTKEKEGRCDNTKSGIIDFIQERLGKWYEVEAVERTIAEIRTK